MYTYMYLTLQEQLLVQCTLHYNEQLNVHVPYISTFRLHIITRAMLPVTYLLIRVHAVGWVNNSK